MNGQDIRTLLGKSLKEIRTSKGLTQEQLSELINKQSHTINRIETGLSFLSGDTLAKLCDCLQVHPSLFFSSKQSFLLKEHTDYVKQINQILQTMPTDKLKDIYNIVCVMNK